MKSREIHTCIVCGDTFTIGDKNGIPNGLGFQMGSGLVYDVCSSCVTYRNKEAVEKIQKAEEAFFKLNGKGPAL